MTMRKTTLLLAAVSLLALAACHRKEDEAPSIENDMIGLNNSETQQPPEAPPVLEPEVPTNNVAAAPPPPPKVSADQQTLDDADATGLTSRLPDNSDGPANPAAAAQ